MPPAASATGAIRAAPSALHAALGAWTDGAIAGGWLPPEAAGTLEDAVVATPGALFGEEEERPLVAALFGGTGVGKSTLMNRLADEQVARASAERPTSREVTLYAHRALHVDRLPETLPLDRVRVTLHGNARWRDVLWLDMPDIDSVERENRALVERWLPHVDALVYVVSPERYRDDEGWRLLLEHGERHAWLFAVNHWDRGDERQLEDFRALLVAAGLDDPLIFRTDSSGAGAEDDFDALEATLVALADRRVVERLEARGVLARLRALRERGDALHARLGDAARLAALEDDWKGYWTKTAAELEESLGWRAETFAAVRYADAKEGWLARFTGRGASAPAVPAVLAGDTSEALPATSLDEAALARVDIAVGRFSERAVEHRALPSAVARRLFDARRADLAERLPSLVDDAVQRALALPGTRLRRFVWHLCRALATLLPLAAMFWIGWRVVDAFARGANDPGAYLGSDFAVNGALLLALAWLLPLFLAARLRPSRERSAARGAREGVARALEEVRVGVGETLAAARAERAALDAGYRALWREDGPSAEEGLPDSVRRMLFDGAPRGSRESGVRASTQSSTAAAPVS